jgi:alkylated DNA repair dioxygenase AlkB
MSMCKMVRLMRLVEHTLPVLSPLTEPFTRELAPGALLAYDPHFVGADDAARLFVALERELPFRQEDVVLFGRRIPQPRLSVWMGDAGAHYTYSGVTREPVPWHPLVQGLRDRLTTACSAPFNSVLCNLYRDGLDSMGFHSDDEPELGPEPTIASLSFGAPRTFILTAKAKAERKSAARIVLASGSLLVMRGRLQARFRHGVPKEPAVEDPRINLTFRQIAAR